MTPIQRKACLALRGLAFGRLGGYRSFARAMVGVAELQCWSLIELTDWQIQRLAQSVRKFRRQIRNPHLLFWAQRTLTELKLPIYQEASQ